MSTADSQRKHSSLSWDTSELDFDLIQPRTAGQVQERFLGNLHQFVWDAASLEGNEHTLAEVDAFIGAGAAAHVTEHEHIYLE
jgi:hypothetical protein